MKQVAFYFLIGMAISACKKDSGSDIPGTVPPSDFAARDVLINNQPVSSLKYDVPFLPAIKMRFESAINAATISSSVTFSNEMGGTTAYNAQLTEGDSTIIITPNNALAALTRFNVNVSTALKSPSGRSLKYPVAISFVTSIDSSDKFPVISDDDLLTLVQRQTFKYFWDFGHPVSGLARERTSSGETCTSGGSGFGIMAMIAAVNRGFITRAQALAKLQTMVSFLKNTAQTFHGAYPHWLNGTSGLVIPFSANDNGADLVETSYLMQGLLCARQYFNGSASAEAALRSDINFIYNRVEWDWFRNGNQQVLYWHWSPTVGWAMNLKIEGWNECLITYVLAAASPTHGIPASVYTQGFARNGAMQNGSTYYNALLPLGPAYGGPLFFSHYSFLGIDPNGLSDAYANYGTQVNNHTIINFNYCVANPQNNFGYSSKCWGLSASDIPNGYTASSPSNDVGVIAPTAAISSMPYTPTESMNALRFFYYKLGDKIWREYGFVDAFSLKNRWYASSFLAIDQGPIIVMIENYRSQLLWNLFTSCPEVKSGMLSLGFAAPYL